MNINRFKALLLFSVFCVLSAVSAFGEEYKVESGEVDVPDSMQVIRKGDVNVVVPKGQRLIPDSSFFVTENPDEYASRKFAEAEARDVKIEKGLMALKDDLENLRKAVESMKREKAAGDK